MWTISIQLRAVCDCHALLWYALNSKHQHTHKKTALKNPWRSHFCIRGENLPEDDDEQSVERRFYIYGCDSVCPNKKVILHCHHSWRITFCSDSKTNTQSELLHSLDKIETKKEQVIQDELINCALWKIYLCVTLTSNSDVVGSQNAMKSKDVKAIYVHIWIIILKGRRDWELLFRAFIDLLIIEVDCS